MHRQNKKSILFNQLKLKIMKNLEILKYRGIVLLPVKDSNFVVINSSYEKARYMENNEQKTYEFHNNGHLVEEYLYMVIDVENNGYCLTPKHAINYNKAKFLIDMYL